MDIDIDIAQNQDVLSKFPGVVRASMKENGELKAHQVGVYFQHVPVDKLTGLAAIPFKAAQESGFFKIDMLNLSLLNNFGSKREINILLKKEPDWSLLQQPDIVPKLFHLAKHADVLSKVKPKTIEELADVLALIRPNKHHLIDKYVRDKKGTRTELYRKQDASDLRKSHAIPYALLIVLQLHLLKEGIEC